MLKIRTFTIDRFNFFKRQICVNRSKIQFNCAISFNNVVFLRHLISVRTYNFANKYVALFFWFAITVTMLANSFSFSIFHQFRWWIAQKTFVERQFENSIESFEQLYWFAKFLIISSSFLQYNLFYRNYNTCAFATHYSHRLRTIKYWCYFVFDRQISSELSNCWIRE